MKLRYLAASLFAWSASAAPADDAKAILADFLAQPSYTWTTVTAVHGIPDPSRDDVDPTAGGEHERDGYTKIHFLRGPHIPFDEWPLGQTWLGFTKQQGHWVENWALETPQGYRHLRDLPKLVPNLPTSNTTRRLNVRRPDHEIAAVVDQLEVVRALGNGGYQAELTFEGAAALALQARKPSFNGKGKATSARGSLKLETKDGVLVSYHLAVDATVRFDSEIVNVRIATTRALGDFGTTKVDVPKPVERILGR